MEIPVTLCHVTLCTSDNGIFVTHLETLVLLLFLIIVYV